MNPNENDATAPIAFCQNCGKPLSPDTVRKVGPAIYCEPCLQARLTGNSGAAPHYGSAARTTPPPYAEVRYATGVNGQPVPMPSVPNPGLAALLGLIPGVGAMYNEQYAKGIVHLAIFAVLITFSHVSDIFGLFAFGWICYMAIEAHHTAKARRDGTPLPNPFGFNDIGDRMGFHPSWPSTPAGAASSAAEAARDAARAAAAGIHAAAGFNRPPAPYKTPVPPASEPSWSAPADQYAPVPPQVPPYNPVYTQAAGQTYAQSYGQAYGQNVSQGPSDNDSAVPPMPLSPAFPNRFPVGAILLIGLGLVFLLETLGLFNAVPGSALVGVVLVMLGAFVFFRRMTDTGEPLAYDGSAAYHLRILRALRGSIWLVAFGVLALLSSFHVANLRYTWPWLVILVGVMMLLQRAVYNSAANSLPYPGTLSYPTPSSDVNSKASAGTDTSAGGL